MRTEEIDGVQYVRVSDIAKHHGVTRGAIYAAVNDGRLSSIRRFDLVFVPLAEAELWQKQPRGGNHGGGRPKKKVEGLDGKREDSDDGSNGTEAG